MSAPQVGKWQAAVLRRGMRSPMFVVTPGCWQERRALRRMAAYGAVWPVVGYPDLWSVIPPELRAKHERLGLTDV